MIDLKIQIEKSKFLHEKLAVLDGLCIRGSPDHMKSGERCLVQVENARDVGRIHEYLVPLESESNTGNNKNKGSTVWITHSNQAATTTNNDGGSDKNLASASVRTILEFQIENIGTVQRNRKGVKLFECRAILSIQERNDDYHADEKNTDGGADIVASLSFLHLKAERHRIFAEWLVEIYGIPFLSSGSGVLDVAGGKGELSEALHSLGVPSVLLDPDPRCKNHSKNSILNDDNETAQAPFEIIAQPLDGDGTTMTDREDITGALVRSCSLIAGMHPDQATEPIVDMAMRLNVPFAVLPCCVMPKLFPNRRQKRHGDPVRSYSTFCQYLLDKGPPSLDGSGTCFKVDCLPFVGRNKLIYRLP